MADIRTKAPADEAAYRLRRFPNGFWRIVWTVDRITHSLSTRTRNELKAKRALADHLATRRARKLRSLAIGAVLEAYLADRQGVVIDERRLKAAAKPLRRHLGQLRPAELTPGRLRRYGQDRRSEGVGDGTVRHELGLLRAALRFARGEGMVRDVPSIALPPPPPPRERWLSRDEAARLIAAVIQPHVRLFVLIALHTAARGGAIRELRWRQVDLDRGLIDFRAPARPRSAKGRAVVPINDTLRAALLSTRETQERLCLTNGLSRDISDGFVIAWRGRPVRSVARGVAAACRRASIAGVTPHVFRHTAATWLAQAGVAIERIAQYLGHTNPVITARVYAKHSPDWLRDAANALG